MFCFKLIYFSYFWDEIIISFLSISTVSMIFSLFKEGLPLLTLDTKEGLIPRGGVVDGQNED